MAADLLFDIAASDHSTDLLFRAKSNDSFSMKSVNFTRRSLWSLCGFGQESMEKYLDDEAVNFLSCLFLFDKSTAIGSKVRKQHNYYQP